MYAPRSVVVADVRAAGIRHDDIDAGDHVVAVFAIGVGAVLDPSVNRIFAPTNDPLPRDPVVNRQAIGCFANRIPRPIPVPWPKKLNTSLLSTRGPLPLTA